jgi:hypothetical protein
MVMVGFSCVVVFVSALQAFKVNAQAQARVKFSSFMR